MHILFIITTLQAGGMERVVARMANHWATSTGWKITIIRLYSTQEPSFYPLHDNINLISLGLTTGRPPTPLHGLKNFIRRMWIIRRVVKKASAEIILSFGDRTNILSLLATRGLSQPIIINERNNPYLTKISKFWRVVRRITYPFTTALTVQTQGAATYFKNPRVQKRTAIMPNPVARPTHQATLSPTPPFQIITIGRLVAQKEQHQLIDAFAQLADSFPEWTLDIWGEGTLRQTLQSQIDRLNLAHRITLRGHTQQPYEIYAAADLFVFSSRFEGFPNALAEAMSVGLPVISYDCPFGPAELIQDGINGILVPVGDVQKLAQAMQTLMANPQTRKKLGQRAQEVSDRFSLARIMQKWEDLISTATGIDLQKLKT